MVLSRVSSFAPSLLKTGNVRKILSLKFSNSSSTANSPVVKEIKIPTLSGELAAKWWGDESRQPVLSLHGWQDNAGSWDRLVPHLPPDLSVLAVDLPGHGKSDWLPKGMLYDNWLYVRIIEDIRRHYGWDTLSFMSHSMGSIISFFYTSLYPETVKFYIAVENIVPDIFGDPKKLYDAIGKNLLNLQVDESRLYSEPPSYPYEEVLMRWHLGTRKSVSLESAPYLVDRGIKQSKVDPKKYYFSRDPRLKNKVFSPLKPEFTRYGITRVQCPTLYLKGTESRYALDELSVSCRELLEKTNKNFEFHLIPGTHHIHLNDAEVVASIITKFLQKHSFVN